MQRILAVPYSKFVEAATIALVYPLKRLSSSLVVVDLHYSNVLYQKPAHLLENKGAALELPEHMVVGLTGHLPEPILMLPVETRDTFELKGDSDESVVCQFVAAWKDGEKKLFDIGKELQCKTKKYGNILLFSRDTGIVVPKTISQEYGIRMDYYLEIVMKKVVKGDQTIDVFPQREVFEHYPAGFEKVAMK